MMPSPTRAPPPKPSSTSPSSNPPQNIEDKYYQNIEDKYYVGLSSTTRSSSSPKKLVQKKPPSEIVGAEALAAWYKEEAKRLHQHANLSQQRNQMLVQKVLEMRRQLVAGNSANSIVGTANTANTSANSTTTPSTSTPSSTATRNLKTTTTTTTTNSSNSSYASPSNTMAHLTVRELGDSPLMQSSTDSSSGNMGDLAWTELKLQRSHHNFHALSKRTREVETSNAKAAQMIVDLRRELEGERIRSVEAGRREVEGKHIISQLSSHIEGLKRQVDMQDQKLVLLESTKTEAEGSAAKWRRERREIGGYALRLEKDNETYATKLQALERKNRELTGELTETRGTLREMHGKLRAHAESTRMRLDVEENPLRRHVETSVLALRQQLDTTQSTMNSSTHESLLHEIKDVRERLDEATQQLQDAHTKNEVLMVRANHAQRSVEEYREKSRRLQEFLTQGASTKENEIVVALSKIATLESNLSSSKKETERCREEIKHVLTAMELARDRLLQSANSKEIVERRCEQLRQQAKDADSKTRTLETRLEVMNEDCLATKKEVGALEADNVHLEQQVCSYCCSRC